jgi:hypothetical protein
MSIGWNPFYANKEKTAEPWILHEFEKVRLSRAVDQQGCIMVAHKLYQPVFVGYWWCGCALLTATNNNLACAARCTCCYLAPALPAGCFGAPPARAL